MATNKNFIVKNGLEVAGNINVTGNITQAGMAMPASDGTSGQYLQTDGSGNLSWSSVVSSFNVTNGTTTDTVATGETITFTGGTNISISVADNNITFDNDIADSDDITEGSNNLFFTDTRAVDAVEGHAHLTIDGGTLYVDTDNNYVGIGDTSPQHKLDVAGNIGVNGTEVITSAGQFVGSVADSALTVGGSLVGPLSNAKVQYGTAYSGTPVQGSFFFDSLNQKLKVYTGSSFVDAVPAGTGGSSGSETDANTTFRKYSYTLASTTNAISGADDNTETLTYVTDGTENVEVFVNGIKQVEGSNRDYVATTGTSVTFTYNVPSGSTVDIQVYELLTNDAYYLKSEVYTKTETNSNIATAVADYLPLTGGTLTGNLTGTSARFDNTAADPVRVHVNNSGTNDYGLIYADTSTAYKNLVINPNGGNVGIGTDSPATALDVTGTVTADGLTSDGALLIQAAAGNFTKIENDGKKIAYFQDDCDVSFYEDTGTTPKFFWDASAESLGIGTSSPSDALDVVGNGKFTGNSVSLINTTSYVFMTPENTGGYLRVGRDTSTGTLYGSPYANVVVGSGAYPMLFGTNNTERMRIDKNGNVGIGTDSPSDRLHVSNGSSGISSFAANTEVLIEDDGNAALQFATPNTQVQQILFSDPESNTAGVIQYNHVDDAMSFDTDGSEAMRIDSSGNVGIGTTSPLAALHIQHSTKPQLLLDGGNGATGDIVVPDGEILQIGHWNSGTSTYTQRITVSSAGNTNIGTGRSSVDESTAQSLSPEAGRGLLSAPWVATSCIEAITEMADGGCGITLGDNGMTGSGQAGAGDEIGIWCDGNYVLNVRGTHANNTIASVEIQGERYDTVSGTSSMAPNSGAMNFKVIGDSDGLAIYNVSSGDYSLCNINQGNGIIYYDGSGGMRGFYDNTEMYQVSASGFTTSSDIRFKEKVGNLAIDATSIINNIQLIEYHPKSSPADAQGDQDETIYGFSAQDLYVLDNNLVSKGADDLDNDPEKLGQYSVKTTSMHALLLKALQEANSKIADLEARIETLENN